MPKKAKSEAKNKGNTAIVKNKGGRPSKMPKFVVAMDKVMNPVKEVLYDEEGKELPEALDTKFIALTEEELLFLINCELEPDERVAISTFHGWKAKSNDDSIVMTPEKEFQMKRFIDLYKRALIHQKQILFQNLSSEDKDKKANWQRFAWIIERKFEDWNLKSISEQKVDHEVHYHAPNYMKNIKPEIEEAKVVEINKLIK